MGILQLYLRSGQQNVKIVNQIPKGNVRLKHVAAYFNVENHGFYMARLFMRDLHINNSQSNLSESRGIIIPLDHTKSFFEANLDFDLSEMEFQRNFEVLLDLDNGHQVVLESVTQAGGAFDFNLVPGQPAWANEDYVLNPPGGTPYVSVGLNADKILDGTIAESSGVIDGPQPFLYTMVLTFEYEDVDSRQNFIR